MPKHKIQQFRPLYIDGAGEILVLLKTGRYVPLADCQLDGLRAFGHPLITVPPADLVEAPPELTIAGSAPTEPPKRPTKKTPRKKSTRGD